MPTYIYLCGTCGSRLTERASAPQSPDCPACDTPMRRDWKGEGVNVAISNLKQAREAGK